MEKFKSLYLLLILFVLFACQTEKKIIPIYKDKPLSSFSKEKLPPGNDHLLGVGGYIYLEPIPIDQSKKVVKAESFLENLGKNLSSVPGKLELDFSSFKISAQEIDRESIKYIRIDEVQLNVEGKGSLEFLKDIRIYLVDPKNPNKESKQVLHYNKNEYTETCPSAKCDWKNIKLKLEKINLIDFIILSYIDHEQNDGSSSKFEFQDIEMKMKLEIDTPKHIKFKIVPKVKFVVGVELNTY